MTDRINDALAGLPRFTEPMNCAPEGASLQETARIGDLLHDSSQAGLRRYAKTVCGDCPAKSQCETYALNNDITDGVWGGLTPQQRHDLTRPSTPATGFCESCGERVSRAASRCRACNNKWLATRRTQPTRRTEDAA